MLGRPRRDDKSMRAHKRVAQFQPRLARHLCAHHGFKIVLEEATSLQIEKALLWLQPIGELKQVRVRPDDAVPAIIIAESQRDCAGEPRVGA